LVLVRREEWVRIVNVSSSVILGRSIKGAYGLFDACARRYDGAQESEIIAGPGCCFCIADCHRDPCSDLFGQLNITVVETLRPQYHRQSGLALR
jgi:hypothetical protein